MRKFDLPKLTKPKDCIKSLKLHLGKEIFVAGEHLSGVVIIKIEKPVLIRSLNITLDGIENPRKIKGVEAKDVKFFHRNIILSGIPEPNGFFASTTKGWNELIGRNSAKLINKGEHVYPFFIPLPQSIPASYLGWAGVIKYFICTTLNLSLGYKISYKTDVKISNKPKIHMHIPISTSYPKSEGNILPNPMKVNVELKKYSVEIGSEVEGLVRIENPDYKECKSINISLDFYEIIKGKTKQGINSKTIESINIIPSEPKAPIILQNFKVNIPTDSNPSVEGTYISATWLLKTNIDCDTPQEIKMPVYVYEHW